jgi:hypothetical protein
MVTNRVVVLSTGKYMNNNTGTGNARDHTRISARASIIHASGRHSSPTPGEYYTYFYNHARRLRLEKLLYLELSRSPNGFF